MTKNAWIIGVTLCISTLLLLQGCTTTKKANHKKAATYQAQLGAGYLQRNRLALAKQYLEKALNSDPGSSEAQHYYALLQERLGDNQQAEAYFRKALSKDGKNPELLNNYGSFLCKINRTEQAEAAFLQATRDPLYKTPAFAYANAGICLKRQGNQAKAETYLRKALSLQPNLPSALFHMAELSYNQRENAKAQAFLYRYNERLPDTPETLLLCHKINKALQDADQATACINRLLSKFPQSREASELN